MAVALATAGGLLGATGCGTDNSRSENQTAARPVKPAKPEAEAAAAPLTVRFYLEYSGGMKGFMPKARGATDQPTGFQTRVRGLVSELNGNPAVGKATYALSLTPQAGQVQHQTVAFGQLKNVLLGDGPAPAMGTEMPELLESVLTQPDAPGQVSVVVSDFIYGPENRGRFAAFQDDIRDALGVASKQQLAVAIYGDTSAFRGRYYPAVKAGGQSARELAGDYVPYYVWVMGPPEQVRRFHRDVLGGDAPGQQVFFGLTYPQPAYAARLQPLLKPQGKLACTDGKTCRALEADLAAGPVEFAVGLDLAALPADQQRADILGAQLVLDAPNAAAELVGGSVRALTATERQHPALAAYTHVARVRVTKVFAPQVTLTLRLPAPGQPAWVAVWATANDADPAAQPARTYRLDWIINGVRKAYGATPPPLFTCPIGLTKKSS